MSAIDVYEVKVSMIWSIKTISNSVSPCFTFWVIWMSASDGSVFPLGWLCIMITFEALHINAPCSSSFVFTNVAFVVPFASCINPIGRLFWFRYPTHISSWCSITSSGKIALKKSTTWSEFRIIFLLKVSLKILSSVRLYPTLTSPKNHLFFMANFS